MGFWIISASAPAPNAAHSGRRNNSTGLTRQRQVVWSYFRTGCLLAKAFPAAQRPPRNPGISLTQARSGRSIRRVSAPRDQRRAGIAVLTTALNNQGDQCETATWISPHHDPAWAIRRTGVIPASSVRRDQWCHIEYANFERANFCSAGNKSGQFQPGDDHALSNRSAPQQFHFNYHRM
jgi:hypothetical protein